MVLYKIKANIQKNKAGEFAKWLPSHTQEVLESPGFKRAKTWKTSDPDSDRLSWMIQYEVASHEALDQYLKEKAPTFQEKRAELFGDTLSIESTVHKDVKEVEKKDDGRPPMSDFPKVYCPFIRQIFPVSQSQWKRCGRRYQLKKPEVYLAVNRINPGYEWVFEDPNTIAVEKLDGTNVKVMMEQGRIAAIQNRKNVIDPNLVAKGPRFIIDGIVNAAMNNKLPLDGQHVGEVIGPKLQGNPYQLDNHEWFDFERSITELRYTSFEKHERTYENWSSWFENHLHSRLFLKRARKTGSSERVFAEGVIFL